jgi:uncharacterized protein
MDNFSQTVAGTDVSTQKNFDSSARGWAAATHLVVYLMFIIPFANIIGPLLIALMRKDLDKETYRHGIQNFNYQLSLLIAIIASTIVFIGGYAGLLYGVQAGHAEVTQATLVASFGGAVLAVVFGLAIAACLLLVPALNGIRAYQGQEPKFPFIISFIKSV